MRQNLLTTIAGGISAVVAGILTGGSDRDIGATATGASSQANSYGLKATLTTFTTVAANTGARLPADLSPGDEIRVSNFGANTLLLYPETGGNINGAGANTAVNVAANKQAIITCMAPGIYSAVIA